MTTHQGENFCRTIKIQDAPNPPITDQIQSGFDEI
jgi:hypothetical protein